MDSTSEDLGVKASVLINRLRFYSNTLSQPETLCPNVHSHQRERENQKRNCIKHAILYPPSQSRIPAVKQLQITFVSLLWKLTKSLEGERGKAREVQTGLSAQTCVLST
ncbi:hypothetical protein KIL84_016803 [Mauremys mutica]|uniref:Uncharacterized protein n=1 Tax=Mauremys mutica TaxID=74926 RepID=A0A9D4AWT2_9SAUR|nr:hypothetical protein KIL84_016803 [Mauremys mutica]